LTHSHKEQVGLRLAQLRKARGFTQTEIAEGLGVTQAHISEYERGRVNLTSDTIIQLTQILKVSADELLGLTPPPKRTVKDHRLVERLALIESLPKRKKDALLLTIRTFLAEAIP
jgi:transcriptional regulator with XRE-family HTH domain